MKLNKHPHTFKIIFTIAIVAVSGLLMSHCRLPVQEKESNSGEQGFITETVVSGLNMPWAVAFLPDGQLLVTERPGKLRLVKDGKIDPKEISGVPKVYYRGQGGLLDVVLHPEYKENGWIYLSYSSPKQEGEEGDENGANTALLRARLKGHELTDIEYLYKASPNVRGTVHFGGKIVFDGKGHVFLTLGERGQKDNAQHLGKAQGKVVRLLENGKVPSDNPFVNQSGVLPEIWSYGHRNPQGLVLDAKSGILWSHEHGPQGGDELNIVEKGKNYGWPLITFGIDYDNSIISDKTAAPGMEQPILQWTPSIAPCGMTMVHSPRFKDWNGNLIVGSLKFLNLERLVIKDREVVKKEVIFPKIGRVRDVREGPDGLLYVVVESGGSIIRISPQS